MGRSVSSSNSLTLNPQDHVRHYNHEIVLLLLKMKLKGFKGSKNFDPCKNKSKITHHFFLI